MKQLRRVIRGIAYRALERTKRLFNVGSRTLEPDGANIAHLRQIVGSNARVLLEIGANDGSDSRRLAKAFRSATIHCFEPDPRPLARLRAIASRNDRLVVHALAICAVNDTVMFHQSSGAPIGQEDEFPDGWHLSGSVRPPLEHLEQHPWCKFDTTIPVEGRRLDTWATEHNIEEIDFIWADVQGAEGDVIEGGTRTLARTRYLYTEFDERELYEGQLTLQQMLAKLPNWEVVIKYRYNVLLRNIDFG